MAEDNATMLAKLASIRASLRDAIGLATGIPTVFDSASIRASLRDAIRDLVGDQADAIVASIRASLRDAIFSL